MSKKFKCGKCETTFTTPDDECRHGATCPCGGIVMEAIDVSIPKGKKHREFCCTACGVKIYTTSDLDGLPHKCGRVSKKIGRWVLSEEKDKVAGDRCGGCGGTIISALCTCGTAHPAYREPVEEEDPVISPLQRTLDGEPEEAEPCDIPPSPIEGWTTDPVKITDLKMRPDDGSDGFWYDIELAAGEGRDLTIEAQDIIEALDLNFAMGNIFKSVVRVGRKPGVDPRRDLRKIIYYAQREIDALTEMEKGGAE